MNLSGQYENKTIHCGYCFTTSLIDTVLENKNKCPKCGSGFQYVLPDQKFNTPAKKEIEDLRDLIAGLSFKINKMKDRISELEEKLKKYTDRADIHETALNRKWQANIEAGRRITELENKLETISNQPAQLNFGSYAPTFEEHRKYPNTCPLCHGEGKFLVQSIEELTSLGTAFIIDALGRKYKKCHSCDGKGILWG